MSNDEPRDLPAALLTEAQRNYLRGERDVSGANERMLRSRIRERLQAGIFDLALITGRLPLDDLDDALAKPEGYESEVPIGNRMSSLATLLYLYNRDDELAAKDQSDGWRTAIDVKRGIERALTRIGVGYESIDVSIEVVRSENLETLAEREDLTSLSKNQLTQLLTAGLITGEEHAQAYWEKKQANKEGGPDEDR